MKNYYEILEVDENASQEMIEKAYRILARRYHPDVQPIEKTYWAEEEFKKVSEAYYVLSDKERRIVYDFENGFTGKSPNYEEMYKNLYSKQETLKENVDTSDSASSEKKGNKSSFISSVFDFKSYASSIKIFVKNQKQKSKQERSTDFKALGLTIIIMAILLIIAFNVPFIRSFLIPW